MTRLPHALRFVRDGWKAIPFFYKILLGILLPSWFAMLVLSLSGHGTQQAILAMAAAGITSAVLVQTYKDGRQQAVQRAATAIGSFLHLIDVVLDQRVTPLDIWEIAPTADGRFKAGLWDNDHPSNDAGFRILPMPGWIAAQALFLVQQEGLRDARPLHALGPKGRWTRALGRHRGQSAHARLAARQDLREALAPHLRPAFDAVPL